jgi:hypothetical protein
LIFHHPPPPSSLPSFQPRQGENGFFKIPRGTNSLFIEEGDCWAATVDWSMEKDVRRGRLVGTMFGVVPAGTADAGEGVGARLVKAAWAE